MLGSCNTANYNSAADWNGLDGNLTTVGSNGKPSYYGTYDQTGNINELLDTNSGNWKIIRGGSFLSNNSIISKNSVDTNIIDLKRTDLGFRIAKSISNIDSINYSLIQDSSNAADSNSIGSVAYNYQIKKYPITNNEYVEFLNAVATTNNSLGLWVVEMSDSSQRGGISRSGGSGGFSYSVKSNMGDKPVNFINWFSAARYINWLHNNKPSGIPSSATTESGVYTLDDFVISGTSKPSRNNTNSYWLPTENEWYKAAYYDVTKNGIGGYWLYATQSDTLPDSVIADSTGLAYDTTNPNNCITPTPSPTVSITPSITPSISISPTATTTPSLSISATKTPTISVTSTTTNTPSITVTKTPTRTRQATPTVTPTISITRTVTMSPTPTKTPTKTITRTPTITPTPSKSMVQPISIGELIYQNSVYVNDDVQVIYKGFHLQGKLIPHSAVVYEIPNASPTPTPSITPSLSITNFPTSTSTPTVSPTCTVSISPTATITPTHSITPTVSSTPTNTPSLTVSPTPTITPSITTSITPTPTVSITKSVTPSATPTASITPTITTTPTVSSTFPRTDLLAIAFNANKNAQSTDSGSTWSLNNMPAVKYWTSVIYDGSKYIACAYNESNVYVSNDGIVWTIHSIANLVNSNHFWVNLAYSNSIFVMTPNSSSVGAMSSNGTSWSEISLPAIGNWKGGSYGNNIFLVVAENSSVGATSTNGITWTQRTLPSSAAWVNVDYLNNNFFVVGSSTTSLLQTTNGTSWSTINLPSTNNWISIAYGNNTYVVLSSEGQIATSTDLITWSSSSLVFGSWSKVFYRNNFIAIGNNLAYTSPNGLTWTQRTIGNYNWFDMT